MQRVAAPRFFFSFFNLDKRGSGEVLQPHSDPKMDSSCVFNASGTFSLSVSEFVRLVVSRALFCACRLTVSVATTLMSLDQTNKGSAVMLHLSFVCVVTKPRPYHLLFV